VCEIQVVQFLAGAMLAGLAIFKRKQRGVADEQRGGACSIKLGWICQKRENRMRV
jgi:hypothetical protein